MLRLEQLEDRCLPTTFTASSFVDGTHTGSLRKAVLLSNLTPQDNVILLQAGTYSLSLAGTGEDSSATGDLDIRTGGHSLTIRGAGSGLTIIDARALDRVFEIIGPGNVFLEGLTIKNGVARDVGSRTNWSLEDSTTVTYTGGAALGGGILNNGANLTLTDVVVRDNLAWGRSDIVVGSDGSHNAQSARGGGIYSAGGTLNLTSSQIVANTAVGGNGTAGENGFSFWNFDIYLKPSIPPVAISLHGQDGDWGTDGGDGKGGGVYVAAGSVTTTLTTIQNNRAMGGEGGRGGDGGKGLTLSVTPPGMDPGHGGDGGDGGHGGDALGGGIYIAPLVSAVSIDTTTIAQNSGRAGAGGDGGHGGQGGDAGIPLPLPPSIPDFTVRGLLSLAAGLVSGDEGGDGGDGGYGGNAGSIRGAGLYLDAPNTIVSSAARITRSTIAFNYVSGASDWFFHRPAGTGGNGGRGDRGGIGGAAMTVGGDGGNGGNGGGGGAAMSAYGAGLYLVNSWVQIHNSTITGNDLTNALAPLAVGNSGGQGMPGGHGFGPVSMFTSAPDGSDGDHGHDGPNGPGGTYQGSAIYANGTVDLINDTIAFNQGFVVAPGLGTAALERGRYSLLNTIVAHNVGVDIGQNFSGLSLGHNLIRTPAAGLALTPGTGDVIGFAQDVGLAPLTTVGPTPTYSLLGSSMALNHGSNAVVSTLGGIDQNGIARQVGANVDIGASEYLLDLGTSAASLPASVVFEQGPASNMVFTVTVRNQGTAYAVNTIADVILPDQVQFRSMQLPPGWTAAPPVDGGPNFVRIFATEMLAPGRVDTFVFAVGLRPTAVPGTTLTLNMSVGVSDVESTPADNSATVSTTVVYPAPALARVDSITLTAGAATAAVMVEGSGFVAQSVVEVGGVAVATTYLGSGRLKAEVPLTQLQTDTAARLSVVNPTPVGGRSNQMTLALVSPALTEVTSSHELNSPILQLQIRGSGFKPGSVVLWNIPSLWFTQPLATRFISPTLLQADFLADLGFWLDSSTFGVFIPTAGGAEAAAPAVTSANLTAPPTGTGPYTLRVIGSGFTAQSVVRWNGSAFTTTFINDTELRITVPAALATGGLPTMISVLNSTAQGGPSNALALGVTAPAITALSTTEVTQSTAAFELTVTGTGFTARSEVRWNGLALERVFVSPTQLRVVAPAGLLMMVGTAQVTVVNPVAEGGVSVAAPFTVRDMPVNLTLVPLDNPVQGIPYPGVVATFTDPNPLGHASQYQAYISWGGDGRSTTELTLATVTQRPDGTFEVRDPSHLYDNYGIYQHLRVNILDIDGASAGTSTPTTRVLNAPLTPSAPLTATNAAEGRPATLLIGTFTDANTLADIHQYTVDILDFGDGSDVDFANRNYPAQVRTNGSGGFDVYVDHRYWESGTYTIKYRLTDLPDKPVHPELGTVPVQDFESTATIVVANSAPRILAVRTQPGVAGVPTDHYDPLIMGKPVEVVVPYFDQGMPDGQTLVLDWGDNTSSIVSLPTGYTSISYSDFVTETNSLRTSHLYSTSGTYTITATLIDQDGASATATGTATVANTRPSDVRLLGADSVNEGQEYTLTGIFTDPGYADTHRAVIDWGDGTSSSVVAVTPGERTFQARHTYAQQSGGSHYAISATVTDNSGDSASTSFGRLVYVSNVAPTVGLLTVTPTSSAEGEVVTVQGTFTDPGLLDSHTVDIYWSDPATGGGHTRVNVPLGERTFSATYKYTNGTGGPATISALVRDDVGISGRVETSVVIANRPPTLAGLTIGTWSGTNVYGAAELSGAVVDPGFEGQTVTIDWGDGSAVARADVGSAQANPGGSGYSSSIVSRHFYTGGPGTQYTVTVTATDADGTSVSGTVTYQLPDQAPSDLRVYSSPGQILGEGDNLEVYGSFRAVDHDTHRVTIDWGDGSTQMVQNLASDVGSWHSPQHRYTNEGTYNVRVTVADAAGGSVAETLVVEVHNQAPVDTTNSRPQYVNENQTATIEGTFTDVGVLDRHTVTIDWRDGSAVEVLNLAAGAYTYSASHQYLNNFPEDSRLIRATVTDNAGASTTHNFLVGVRNAAPTNVTVATSATTINQHQFITVSGSFADDGTLDAHTVVIIWGDGTPSTTLNLPVGVYTYAANHTYHRSSNGSFFEVRTQVTDDAGGYSALTSVASTTMTVLPVDALTGLTLSLPNGSLQEGGRSRLRGNFTNDPTFAHRIDVAWGDGIVETFYQAAGVQTFDVFHTYANNGTGNNPHVITATVTTLDTGASLSSSILQTVANVAPVISSPQPGPQLYEGQTFSFLADVTDLDAVTGVIDWGDGSTPTMISSGASPLNNRNHRFEASHQYADNAANGGQYQVRFTATDSDGAVVSATTTVSIQNQAPLLLGPTLTRGQENSTLVRLTGSLTDSGAHDNHTVTIIWGDGSTPTTLLLAVGTLDYAAEHRYTQSGSYAVTITAMDKDGASTTTSVTAFVDNMPATNLLVSVASNSIVESQSVILSGSFTDPGLADAHIVTINWGDGSSATELQLAAGVLTFQVVRPYSQDASTAISRMTFPIQVSVRDTDSLASTFASTLVAVSDAAPFIASTTVTPTLIKEGEATTLTVLFHDAGISDTHSITVDWGDGNRIYYAPGSGLTNLGSGGYRFSAAHTYLTSHVTTPRVTITDDRSGTSASQEFSVVVANVVAPFNRITIDRLGTLVDTVAENTTVNLSAWLTEPDPNDTHRVIINWGDGSPDKVLDLGRGTTSFQALHTFANNLPGNSPYTIRVTSTEGEGGTSTVSTTLTVTDVLPQIQTFAARQGAVPEGWGTAVQLVVSEVGPLDRATATIDWGDGQTDTFDIGSYANLTPVHLYANNRPGNAPYTITARVTTEAGATVQATTTAVVQNVAPRELGLQTAGQLNEGDTHTLTGSFRDHGYQGIQTGSGGTVVIDWGDGSPTTTLTIGSADVVDYGGGWQFIMSHRYLDNQANDAPYTVHVTVTDEDGAAITASQSVTVRNVRPTASYTYQPQGATEGQAITLSAAVSEPGELDRASMSYAWTVTCNGQTSTTSIGASFTFTPDDNGTYKAWLRVTDKDGAIFDTAATTIEVANAAPANLAVGVSATSASEGDAITLAGSFTDLSSTDAHTVFIHWNDATTRIDLAAGVFTFSDTHTFTQNTPGNGPRDVVVQVFDKDGASISGSRAVSIANVAPTGLSLFLSATTVAESASPITLSGSFTDLGVGDTHRVFIDWGDGSGEERLDLLQGTRTFARNHSYKDNLPGDAANRIRVRVVDESGGQATAETSLGVTNRLPSLQITEKPNGPLQEGALVTVRASVSDPGEIDQAAGVAIRWEAMRNGAVVASGNGTVATFVADDGDPDDHGNLALPGAYQVRFSATDKDGGQSSVTARIDVINQAPTAFIDAPASVSEGSTVRLEALAADSSAADQAAGFSYTWTVRSSSNSERFTGTGSTLTFQPSSEGNYGITLEVRDKDGGYTLVQRQLQVDRVPGVAAILIPTTGYFEAIPFTLVGTADFHSATDNALPVSYFWSVRQGNQEIFSSTEAMPQFTALDGGTYTVHLFISNARETVEAQVQTIVIANLPPTVEVSGLLTAGTEGNLLRLSSDVDDSAPDLGAGFMYAWTVTKDGNVYATRNSPNRQSGSEYRSFDFTPNDQGTYRVNLTVTDKDGGATTVTSDPIVVANANPVATITGAPTSSPEGSVISLGSTVSDAGPLDGSAGFIYAWSVTRNDAAYATGSATSFTFTPNDNGSYVVTLTVTDKDGGVSTPATATVNVFNTAPTVTMPPVSGRATTGNAINLTSLASDLSSVDVSAGLTYAWTVTRSGATFATGATANFSFTPDLGGSYTVGLTVSDKDGSSVCTPVQTIQVTDTPPTVAIVGAPDTSTEGAALALASFVNDPDSTGGFHYAWSVTKGGSNYGDAGSAATFSFTPNDQGTYVVSLTVTDPSTAATTETHTIQVTNMAPVVAIHGAPTTAPEGAVLNLTATASDVGPLDTTFTYAWSVTRNDVAYGSTGNAANFTFTPSDQGTYIVSLTATDKDGTATTTSTTVAVVNVAPVVSITNLPVNATEGMLINLGSAVTDVAADMVGRTYTWNVTWNGRALGASGTAASHEFKLIDNGSYTVTLTVTDKDGATTTTTSTFTATNVTPTAMVNGVRTSSPEGTPITLTSTVTEPGELDAPGVVKAWTILKNGAFFTSGEGETFTFTPDDEGVYAITLTVTDRDSASFTTPVQTVTVFNVQPAVAISAAPSSPVEGTTITLTSSVTEPGLLDAAALTYAWVVTRNGTLYAESDATAFSFMADDQGVYKVSLTVTDPDGSVGVAQTEIVVTNSRPVIVAAGPDRLSINEDELLLLSALATDAGPLDRNAGLTYVWEVSGQGLATTGNGTEFAVTIPDSGQYVVNLTVFDKDGAGVQTGWIVASANRVPQVTISAPPTDLMEANTPVPLSFTATVIDVPADTAAGFNASWRLFRNSVLLGTGNGLTVNTSLSESGSYFVDFAVSDKDGAASYASRFITVNNAAPTVTIRPDTTTGPEGTLIPFAIDIADTPGDMAAGFSVRWSVVGQTAGLVPINLGGFGNTEVSYTSINNGTYTVSWEVRDRDGALTRVSRDFTVTNVAPTLTLSSAPDSSPEGAPITLTASAADVGIIDAQRLFIGWQVTRGGTVQATGSGPSFTFTPDDQGTYVITGSVTDPDGATTSVTRTVTVTNAAPTAALAAPLPTTSPEGTPLFLEAAATDPSAADRAGGFTYAWTATRNGTAYATGASAAFAFTPNDQGSYTVTLTVTDKDGATSAQLVRTVNVLNQAPVITSVTTSARLEGLPLILSASAQDVSTTDTATGLTYTWTVSKGTTPFASGTGANYSFVPDDDGWYVYTLDVTDKDGGRATVTEATLVLNLAPTPTITGIPVSHPEGTAITLGSSVAEFGPVDSARGFTYGWTVLYQDRIYATGSNANLTFTPTDNGTYNILLHVTDKDGAFGLVTQSMTVTNVAPSAVITGPTTAREGELVTLHAAATDVSAVDQAVGFTATWEVFQNGSLLTSATGPLDFSFTTDNQGVYVARVRVTDKDGTVSSVAEHTFQVTNAPPTALVMGAPESVWENTPIRVSAFPVDPSSADRAAGYSYAWTVTRNGSTYATATGPSHRELAFTIDRWGTYVVALTVYDQDGAAGVADSVTIMATDRAPVVSITEIPFQHEVGLPVTLRSTVHDDPFDTAVGFTYDWVAKRHGNDPVTGLPVALIQTRGSGADFTFIPVSGSYTVELVVTDSGGARGFGAASFVAFEVKLGPVVQITGAPQSVTEGTQVTLGSVITDDALALAAGHRYEWTLTQVDDPARPVTALGTTAAVSFVVPDQGSYQVGLKVYDRDGLAGVAGSAVVTYQLGKETGTRLLPTSPALAPVLNVTNAAPVIQLSTVPALVPMGTDLRLAATATDAGPVDSAAGLTYAWTVTRDGRDHVNGTAAAIEVQPDRTGTYIFRLTVTDKDGASASVERTVVVFDPNPAALIRGVPDSAVEDTSITVSAEVTNSAIDPSSLVYAWFVTRGEELVAARTAPVFTFSPADGGDYLIRLTVIQPDGSASLIATMLPVTNRELPPTGGNPTTPSTEVVFAAQTLAASASVLSDYSSNLEGAVLLTGPTGATPASTVTFVTPISGAGEEVFEISGQVSLANDENNADLGGITVILEREENGVFVEVGQTQTARDGSYTFRVARPGRYRVKPQATPERGVRGERTLLVDAEGAAATEAPPALPHSLEAWTDALDRNFAEWDDAASDLEFPGAVWDTNEPLWVGNEPRKQGGYLTAAFLAALPALAEPYRGRPRRDQRAASQPMVCNP